MNWNNQGDYWHIDHIKLYNNTQPMEALENRLKSDKIL
jgi:hypothetical protein